MELEFASCVSIGVKETNDDRVWLPSGIQDRGVASQWASIPTMAAVCDGCGGYAGGFLAAETVLETLGAVPAEALLDTQRLSQTLAQCQAAVLQKKQQYLDYQEMCTTVAGCLFAEDCTILFHAGDSRVYRYDSYGLVRMTVDHSAVQEMVDCGRITEAEAKYHPKRNIITRCLGIDCPPPDIYVSRCPIEPGEIYLLCSDGLWEYVPEEELRQLLGSQLTLPQMAEAMVSRALTLGSDDNVSVCLCRCPGGPQANGTEEAEPFVLD